MTTHVVKAPVVKVSIGEADGHRVARILREGAPVPEGVAKDQLEALVKRGLIAKAPARKAKTAKAPEGQAGGAGDAATGDGGKSTGTGDAAGGGKSAGDGAAGGKATDPPAGAKAPAGTGK